jgi:uncharacterized membrane protein YhaH (DUF805 family)
MPNQSVPLNRPIAASSVASPASIPSIGFGAAVTQGFSNYIAFSGRARRAEYWYWTLFTLLLNLAILLVVPRLFGASMASSLYMLASVGLLLPSFGVLIRRLHDTDRSGWWCLLPLTVIGSLVLLVWLCQEGTQDANRFGPRTT